MKHKVDYVLDFRGGIASIMMLKLTDLLREIDIDQTIGIRVDDEDTITDIFQVLPASAYELCRMENKKNGYLITIRKSGKI